jgi:hypothetical protein
VRRIAIFCLIILSFLSTNLTPSYAAGSAAASNSNPQRYNVLLAYGACPTAHLGSTKTCIWSTAWENNNGDAKWVSNCQPGCGQLVKSGNDIKTSKVTGTIIEGIVTYSSANQQNHLQLTWHGGAIILHLRVTYSGGGSSAFTLSNVSVFVYNPALPIPPDGGLF